ncbi:hypothetical protein D3C80_2204850 [compost metagenome]
MCIIQYRNAQAIVFAMAGADLDQFDSKTLALWGLAGSINHPLTILLQANKLGLLAAH